MSNYDLAVIVLAAGKGTRLKSSLAKVLHKAGGRTLVEHIVRACEPLKARETVVVVGHQAEQVAAVVEPLSSGSLLMMSLIYATELGLNKLAGIEVTGAVPAGHPPLATVMQTGWIKLPCTMPVVGSVGLNVV